MQIGALLYSECAELDESCHASCRCGGDKIDGAARVDALKILPVVPIAR